MEKLLTIATVTYKFSQTWKKYCERMKKLLSLYPKDSFDILILDNTQDHKVYLDKLKYTENVLGKGNFRMGRFKDIQSCRNCTPVFAKTPYIAILDDDDILVDDFLQIFHYYVTIYPDVELFNFRKLKVGGAYNVGHNTIGSDDVVVESYDDRYKRFYQYDKYEYMKMSAYYYPINGYNVLTRNLYYRLYTFERYVEDMFAMNFAYLIANKVVLSPTVWQLYESQNHDVQAGKVPINLIVESCQRQMSALRRAAYICFEEFNPSNPSYEWVKKILDLQESNITKSIMRTYNINHLNLQQNECN